MTDIAKLKAAAEKATPGPWRLTVTRFNGITRGPFSLTKEDALANAAEKVDAEFIAAANPAAVLELIAALEAAEKHIAELEAAPVAPVAEGETAVMPDYPGTALTQRECYQLGLEAGKAETQTTSQWQPAARCEVCVEGTRGGCSTCAYNLK
ncbi:ead/Ea22-like family protein [Franconibacter helveticus]|uniref:ead/Ea22-like family protein n=1 Tax=Franconibacter helveticus TaxID=357240 RepID=UPI000DA1EA67|nr:ead/Ea22-like family protein [Franconibacter helveticus]